MAAVNDLDHSMDLGHGPVHGCVSEIVDGQRTELLSTLHTSVVVWATLRKLLRANATL